MNHYDKQKGSLHWPKIDPTARQKTAFTSGHFLLRNGARFADMGCGWGEGSYYLALLNPQIRVVGVDNDPARLAHARQEYGHLPNLSFVEGDIEAPPPSLNGFDGFLNSSVLHHVSSYNEYRISHVVAALQNQFAALAAGGILAVRDFASWPKDRFVRLDLPDGKTGDTPETMNSPDLLLHYAHVARSLAAPQDRGFFLDELAPPAKGWRRFYLPAFWAADFLLRKDYRKSFYSEAQEEYGIFSPEGYGRVLAGLGGRVVYRGPFWNRWIVTNRWAGKARLWDEDGKPMDFPPTNYVAIVEKTPPGRSLRLGERSVARRADGYLRLESFRNNETGAVYDMVSRPGEVMDCLPYYAKDGTLYVAAKNGYPRPLVNVVPRGTAALDGKVFSGHLVELVAMANVRSEKDIRTGLLKKAGLWPDQIRKVEPALTYYPAPGLANERVSSLLIELDQSKIDSKNGILFEPSAAVSGFSASGDVRLYRAQELLRSAQVGILPEARLELNVYALMRKTGCEPEAWLDGIMEKPSPSSFEPADAASLFRAASRRLFTPQSEPGGYLTLLRSLFEERSAETRLAAQELEFVLPARASANAGVVFPLAQTEKGELCLGLMEIDLPAPQAREGDSRIFVAPIYRLPFGTEHFWQAETFIAKKLGCRRRQLRRLGEGFYSSIGMTPEKLYPYAAAVDPSKIGEKLSFVRLTDFFAHLEKWRDAPLLIGGLRAIHALGVWKDCAAARYG